MTTIDVIIFDLDINEFVCYYTTVGYGGKKVIQVTLGLQGPAEELVPFMEGFARTIRDASAKSSVKILVDRKATEATFKTGEDGFYVQMVWNKISSKAKRALLYIANHDHCTKEEIVNGVEQLSDTRDLGGALSSVARRCKGLLFDLNIIYEKIETARGPRYVMVDSVSDAIKILGENIDDNDPADASGGEPDEE